MLKKGDLRISQLIRQFSQISMGFRGQAVMIVECEKTVTGSNLGQCTLISDIEILSGTDERNRPRNMSAGEFTH